MPSAELVYCVSNLAMTTGNPWCNRLTWRWPEMVTLPLSIVACCVSKCSTPKGHCRWASAAPRYLHYQLRSRSILLEDFWCATRWLIMRNCFFSEVLVSSTYTSYYQNNVYIALNWMLFRLLSLLLLLLFICTSRTHVRFGYSSYFAPGTLCFWALINGSAQLPWHTQTPAEHFMFTDLCALFAIFYIDLHNVSYWVFSSFCHIGQVVLTIIVITVIYSYISS